jgi:hypothetical protein
MLVPFLRGIGGMVLRQRQECLFQTRIGDFQIAQPGISL